MSTYRDDASGLWVTTGSVYDSTTVFPGQDQWPKDVGADLNALKNQKIYDMTVMPDIIDTCISNPGTGVDNSFSLALNGGKLRATAAAGNNDGNVRRSYAMGRYGTWGDFEMRSKIDSTSDDWNSGANTSLFQWGHNHRVKLSRHIHARLAATSGGANTISATGKFTASDLIGQPVGYRELFVTIDGGPGQGQTKRVIANTADTITVDSNWTTNPTSASHFIVWSVETSSVTVCVTIAFGFRWNFQCTHWNGNGYFTEATKIDLGAYLTGGTPQPLFFKSKIEGRSLSMAIWRTGESEPDYSDTSRAGSWVMTDTYASQGAGMHGLYLGHMTANQWLAWDNVEGRRVYT